MRGPSPSSSSLPLRGAQRSGARPLVPAEPVVGASSRLLPRTRENLAPTLSSLSLGTPNPRPSSPLGPRGPEAQLSPPSAPGVGHPPTPPAPPPRDPGAPAPARPPGSGTSPVHGSSSHVPSAPAAPAGSRDWRPQFLSHILSGDCSLTPGISNPAPQLQGTPQALGPASLQVFVSASLSKLLSFFFSLSLSLLL